MKKRWIILGILALILPFIFAVQTTQQVQVDKAISCLEKEIQSKTCDSLSTEEKIFSLLGIQKCESELLSASKNDYECWPKSGCTIKQTSQAIMALDSVGTSTEKAEAWLLSNTKTPSDIAWYLQIDSREQTSCTISYSGSSNTITIDDEKKINTNAGECLRLAQDNYWLRVVPDCYGTEFAISCDAGFTTNLLFKEPASPIIYISEKINSGTAQSTIKEKIDSKCFSTTEVCDYEGTLWASLALKQSKKDVFAFVPYLVVSASKNEKHLPEAFLYILAGTSYYNDLFLKQKNEKYWDASGDKLYDTALALYPLQEDTSTKKTNAVAWLLEAQKDSGCWDTIRNTGFILYSVWPVKPETGDCADAGGYCMPEADCEGNILSGICTGTLSCCSTPLELESCSLQGGEICSSDETCEGDTTKASNTNECCLGSCTSEPTPSPGKSGCEENKGVCRNECYSDESEKTFECDSYSDVCCIKLGGQSYWYIWLLIILIVLTIIAIIFRDKLKFYWHKFSSKFGKASPPPAQFPQSSQQVPRGIFRRKIIPDYSQHRPVRKPVPQPKYRDELDDVLKKLKEIGK